MSKKQLLRGAIVAIAATGTITTVGEAAPKASDAITIVGLTGDGTSVVTFPADKPQRATDPVAIAGLATGETVVGIDRRPATGELYAVTSTSRLLVVDEGTGATTPRGTLTTALVGTSFGVDFNPTVDRLRIISDAEQNLRVNPVGGATLVDSPLNYAATSAFAGTDPQATAAAYENNDNSATTGTRLFDLDTRIDQLVLQNPPNAGTLTEVGPLTKDAGSVAGFDIYSKTAGGAAVSNQPYAVFGKDGANGTQKLYTVDTTTGAATPVGPFGSQDIADIAVPTS